MARSEEIIKTWYRVSKGEKFNKSGEEYEIFKFMALWMAFNSYLTWKKPKIYGDKAKVMKFAKENAKAKENHIEFLKDNKYIGYVEEIKRDGVTSMRDDSNHVINNVNCLYEVMKCIYTIRCNLFHGGKSKEGRDLKLVESAHYILDKLFKPIQENL